MAIFKPCLLHFAFADIIGIEVATAILKVNGPEEPGCI
jgi:hypothetical protein